MERKESAREAAVRTMHQAIQRAFEDRGPAKDRAWLAVTYVEEALAAEGLKVTWRNQPPA
jgi:hypothetical protein